VSTFLLCLGRSELLCKPLMDGWPVLKIAANKGILVQLCHKPPSVQLPPRSEPVCSAVVAGAQLSLDKFYDGAGGDDPLLSSGRRVLAPRSPGGANFSGPPSSPPRLRRAPSAGGALPLGDHENDENAPGAQENGHHSAPEDGEKTPRRGGASSVDIRRMQSLFKTAAEDNVRSIKNYVTELKERIAKLHYQKQLLVCQVGHSRHTRTTAGRRTASMWRLVSESSYRLTLQQALSSAAGCLGFSCTFKQ
jgi:hypothetical protein